MSVFSRPGRVVIGRSLAALLLVLAGLWPSPSSAGQQPPKSLGEIAREEAARRKAVAARTKVYTKDDLPGNARLTLPAPASTPAGEKPADAAAGEKPGGKADESGDSAGGEGEEKDEAWWRARVTKVREGLRRSEMFAQALETRINSLNADFNSRDDPFQRAAVAEERTKAVSELESVRTEIKTLQQEMAAIEEEARRANVPPGWVR